MSKKILPEPESNHFYDEEEFKKELEKLPSFTIETMKYLVNTKIQANKLISLFHNEENPKHFYTFFLNYFRKQEKEKLDFVQKILNSYYGEARTFNNKKMIEEIAKEFYNNNKIEINSLYARIHYKKFKGFYRTHRTLTDSLEKRVKD